MSPANTKTLLVSPKMVGLAGSFILLSVLCLIGCAPLFWHSYDKSFGGLDRRLDEAATNGGAMHMIVVHGMGNHDPGYSTRLSDGLARYLNLVLQTNPPAAPLPGFHNVTNWLKEYSYTGRTERNRRMLVHEVTWTPTTRDIKQSAFTNDAQLDSHRVLVNKSLKTQLMNNAFPDAILYLNPVFRRAMQDPILKTIKKVAAETGPHDAIVLVASSLGSKMTFDTIIEFDETGPPGERSVAKHFTERLTDIIMLANQLPLLHLGTATNLGEATVSPDTALKKVLRKSRNYKSEHFRTERRPTSHEMTIEILAASDPNDLLTYPLSEKDAMPDDGNANDVEIHVSNIYMHNAGAILCVFENPAAAHEDYDRNEWLLKALVSGYGKVATPSPK